LSTLQKPPSKPKSTKGGSSIMNKANMGRKGPIKGGGSKGGGFKVRR